MVVCGGGRVLSALDTSKVGSLVDIDGKLSLLVEVVVGGDLDLEGGAISLGLRLELILVGCPSPSLEGVRVVGLLVGRDFGLVGRESRRIRWVGSSLRDSVMGGTLGLKKQCEHRFEGYSF